jgi:hypothetical protein
MDELLTALEREAWVEHAHGHTCCAQQAWAILLRLKEAMGVRDVPRAV